MNKFSMIFIRALCVLMLSLVLVFLGCTEEPTPIAVTSVTLDSTSMSLVEAESQRLTATVSPSNAENKTVIWTSSNSSVASVKDGVVTAMKAGNAAITVKTDDGGKTATCKVTVKAKVYPVKSVSLNKTSYELTEGDEFTLGATVKPDNATNKNVTWSSSNTSVASVKEGVVTAMKAGNATITVKTDDGGKTATCEVTVNAKYPVEGVSLNKTSYELEEGDEFTLTATVKPDNATNKNVIWTSSNELVAKVSNGKVTALKMGTVTITVKTEDGGKTATCDVLVKNKIDLSAAGTANCYIVSSAGSYKFASTKGNTSTLVRSISSAEVLWESFGTDVIPNVGDLVKNVNYHQNGFISFETPSEYKEGNAVIAAKDAAGNILWSWHIWLTDQPEEQEYYNNAGIMMDRNLGATSATPGDVGALGLLYQWGRKDPFLGSSSISSNIEAKSTIAWPSAVDSDSSNGTIAYATANPTTFITYHGLTDDWLYTWYSSIDNTRWATSESSKSIYDPCPSGWRVPDGGDNGIWSKAGFDDTTYDSTNEGISFSISSPSKTWYPASGYRSSDDGHLGIVGNSGWYWSASTHHDSAYILCFSYDGFFECEYGGYERAAGLSVRCIQE